jgi:hypothetical protein
MERGKTREASGGDQNCQNLILFVNIMHLLKILAFVARITAINNYHGTNQKRENRFLTNQKAAVIILAQ